MGSASKKVNKQVNKAEGNNSSFLSSSPARSANRFLDPLDLFGGEKRQKEKEAQANKDANSKKAKEAQNSFLDDYTKNVNLKRVDGIAGPNMFAGGAQGAANYQSGLSAATGDVGYLRGIGQSDGLTKGGQAQMDLARANELSDIESGRTASSRLGAEQFSNLASTGGASAGSRERLARGLGSQSLREEQAARRQASLNRLGITSQDEATKLDVARALPAQQLALSGEQRSGLTADNQAQYATDTFNTNLARQQNQSEFENQQNLYKLKAGFTGSNLANGSNGKQSASYQF